MTKNDNERASLLDWMELIQDALREAELMFAVEGRETAGAFGLRERTSVGPLQPDESGAVPNSQDELVRVEVALPLRRNDGSKLVPAELGDVYFRLTTKFAGLTAWPSLGLSVESTRAEIDEHVWLTVIIPDYRLDQMREYLAEIGIKFGQREVFCLVSPARRLPISNYNQKQSAEAAE